jgi:hypothetical protein
MGKTWKEHFKVRAQGQKFCGCNYKKENVRREIATANSGFKAPTFKMSTLLQELLSIQSCDWRLMCSASYRYTPSIMNGKDPCRCHRLQELLVAQAALKLLHLEPSNDEYI